MKNHQIGIQTSRVHGGLLGFELRKKKYLEIRMKSPVNIFVFLRRKVVLQQLICKQGITLTNNITQLIISQILRMGQCMGQKPSRKQIPLPQNVQNQNNQSLPCEPLKNAPDHNKNEKQIITNQSIATAYSSTPGLIRQTQNKDDIFGRESEPPPIPEQSEKIEEYSHDQKIALLLRKNPHILEVYQRVSLMLQQN